MNLGEKRVGFGGVGDLESVFVMDATVSNSPTCFKSE